MEENNVENLTLSKSKKPVIFAQSKKGPDRNPARFIQYPRPLRNLESPSGLTLILQILFPAGYPTKNLHQIPQTQLIDTASFITGYKKLNLMTVPVKNCENFTK